MITYPMPTWDYKQAQETRDRCEQVRPEDYDLVHDPDVTILVSVGRRTIYVTRFLCLPSAIDPKSLDQESPHGP